MLKHGVLCYVYNMTVQGLEDPEYGAEVGIWGNMHERLKQTSLCKQTVS